MNDELMVQLENQTSAYGKVTYANEVVATIAGLAAQEIKGVFSLTGGVVSDFLSSKVGKGVRVELGTEEVAIDLSMVIDFGVIIKDVASAVQENVKKSVEMMTGLRVVEVNVLVQGVNFPKEPKEAPKELKEPEPPRVR